MCLALLPDQKQRHLHVVPNNITSLRARRTKRRTWRYISTKESLKKILPILAAYLKQKGPEIPKFAIDLETWSPTKRKIPRCIWNGTEWEGKIRTLQIGLDPTNPEWDIRDLQFVIDVQKIGEKVVAAALKPLLEQAIWLMQRGAYDCPFMDEFLDIKPLKVIDTMLISQIYWSGDHLNHSLNEQYRNFLADKGKLFYRLTGKTFEDYEEYKKRMQKGQWTNDILTWDQLNYGADDVRLIFYVYEAQKEAVRNWQARYERHFPDNRGIQNIIELEMAIHPVFVGMEQYGLKADQDYLNNKVIPFMDGKIRQARKACAAFPILWKAKPTDGSKQLSYMRDGEPNRDSLKLLKGIILKLFPNINSLSVSCRKQGKDGTYRADITWKGAPNRRLLQPIVRGIMNKEQGWSFLNDIIVNPRSPQIVPIINKIIGKKQKKRDEKSIKAFIEEMGIDNPKAAPLLALLNYVKALNYQSKYGRGMRKWIYPTGYVYPTWNQIGREGKEVVSGRSSNTEPAIMTMASRENLYVTLKYKGIQSAKLLRPMWIPEEGCVFICADYSQIEPRLIAEKYRDKFLRSIFLEGKDQHGLTAQFLLKLKKVPLKGDTLRDDFGKIANLGMGYGMGWRGLQLFLAWKLFGKFPRFSDKKVKRMWNRYWKLYAGVKKAIDRVERRVTAKVREVGSLAPYKGRKPFAVIWTDMGRHRRFCLTKEQELMDDEELAADYEDDETWYRYNEFNRRVSDIRLKAYNHTIQGTAGDMLKLAQYYVLKAIRKKGWDVTLNHIKIVMHDELVVQAEERYAKEMEALVHRCMYKAASRFLKTIPIEIQIGIGKNWFEAGKNAKHIPQAA